MLKSNFYVNLINWVYINIITLVLFDICSLPQQKQKISFIIIETNDLVKYVTISILIEDIWAQNI
jgi:hypothetical protein